MWCVVKRERGRGGLGREKYQGLSWKEKFLDTALAFLDKTFRHIQEVGKGGGQLEGKVWERSEERGRGLEGTIPRIHARVSASNAVG